MMNSMCISSSSSPSLNSIKLHKNHQPKPYLSNFTKFQSFLNHTKLCSNIKRNKLYVKKVSGYLSSVSEGDELGGQNNVELSKFSILGFGGRVGLQRRQGNVSLLSFCGGDDESSQLSGGGSDGGGAGESSEVLSAMLPFVVVATAVAALSRPSTFTW